MTWSSIAKSFVWVPLVLVGCGGSGGNGDPVGPPDPDPGPPGLPDLREGTGRFEFSGSLGAIERPLTVHYHRPESIDVDSPILFVMHGNGRNATGYRDVWIPLAEEYDFLLIVPEFSSEQYPSSRHYHQGNIRESSGAAIDSTFWSFTTLEAIFDEVRERTGTNRTTYNIYGHSAGSQFVHRFLQMMPGARIAEAVAANAGWYTLPDGEEAWPYGLGGVSTEAQFDIRLRNALGTKVTVLLGERDTNTEDADLRTTPEAMEQGPHRLARGHYFYQYAADMGDEHGIPFNWSLETVPGVAHSNGGMAPAAAAAMSW